MPIQNTKPNTWTFSSLVLCLSVESISLSHFLAWCWMHPLPLYQGMLKLVSCTCCPVFLCLLTPSFPIYRNHQSSELLFFSRQYEREHSIFIFVWLISVYITTPQVQKLEWTLEFNSFSWLNVFCKSTTFSSSNHPLTVILEMLFRSRHPQVNFSVPWFLYIEMNIVL